MMSASDVAAAAPSCLVTTTSQRTSRPRTAGGRCRAGLYQSGLLRPTWRPVMNGRSPSIPGSAQRDRGGHPVHGGCHLTHAGGQCTRPSGAGLRGQAEVGSRAEARQLRRSSRMIRVARAGAAWPTLSGSPASRFYRACRRVGISAGGVVRNACGNREQNDVRDSRHLKGWPLVGQNQNQFVACQPAWQSKRHMSTIGRCARICRGWGGGLVGARFRLGAGTDACRAALLPSVRESAPRGLGRQAWHWRADIRVAAGYSPARGRRRAAGGSGWSFPAGCLGWTRRAEAGDPAPCSPRRHRWPRALSTRR
jgi:hypothetical protein